MPSTRLDPVKLKVDGQELTFETLADFEFCLDARTQVPAQKLMSLAKEGAERLHDEALNIRKVERRFTDVLTRSLDGKSSLSTSMRELDRQLFSQDFRWRSIMAAVVQLPSTHDAFRQCAMVRYLTYLRSRQETLRAAYVDLRRRDDTPSLGEPVPNAEVAAEMRATSIFDVEDIPSTQAGPDGYASLPRGETVKVRLPSAPMPIFLSRHRFELIVGPELMLRDDDGEAHPLHAGRNVVGRDLDSDVVVDAGCRDISRRHLIIEASTPDWLQLTDLSSHGTRVLVGLD